MTKKDIGENLYKLVVEENRNIYKNLFSEADCTNVTDSYWKEALSFYKELSNTKKDSLFKIIEQVQVDTISSVLGLLDGTVTIKGDIEFNVSIKGTGKVINGELQDIFLEYVEDTRD